MKVERIAQLLPEVFAAAHQPGSVLDAVLRVMEAFHAPNEELLNDLERMFDPWRAPDEFVMMLASWLALGPYLKAEGGRGSNQPDAIMIDPANLRGLTAHAAELGRIRGTAANLIRFLELGTGLRGFELRDGAPGPDGQPSPFAMQLMVPAAASSCRHLIDLIVAREKPAFSTVDVSYQNSDS